MTILFEKMAMLIVLMGLGYLSVRLKLVSAEFNKGLSKLVMNVFLVGMILSSVVNKELSLSGKDIILGIGLFTLLLLLSFLVAAVAPKILGIKDGDMGMYRLVVSFPNNGFMGFPLVAALYGSNTIFFASLSNIPFNILLYSYGVFLLQKGDGKAQLRFKDMITTPLIATILAVIIFSFNIRMPQIVEDVLGYLSTATVPLSMMCIGLSLGNSSLKELFVHPRFYGLSFMRLIVCPLLVWFVLHFFVTDPVVLGTVVVLAACPSAVVCAILGIDYGRDGVEASEQISLCTILSMITIPFIVYILNLV